MTATATKDDISARELRRLPIPQAWAGLAPLRWAAWAALALSVAVAGYAFTQGALLVEIVAVAAGLWLFSIGWWLGHGRDGRWAIASTAACAAAAVYAGWTAVAIALVALAAALAAIGARALARRARTARTLVWLAHGLGPATGDRRAPQDMLEPTWNSDAPGLPIAWLYPRSMTPDQRRTTELEALVGTRLGTPVTITWGPGAATITAGAPTEPEDETDDPAMARLNAVLRAMLPGARVAELEHDETGAFQHLTFTWPSERAMRVSPVAFRGRIARTLQDALGAPIAVSWDLPRDRAHVAPLAVLPDRIEHPPRNPAAPMQAVFGQFRDGRPCVWDLNSTLPHVLIVGGTGGGKTVLLLSLLTALPQTADVTTEVYAIDPKRVGLKNIARIPGVHAPATTPAAFVSTLLKVQAIMDRRYVDLEADTIDRDELAPIVLFIDEGQEMYDALRAWWGSGDGKKDWVERHALEKAPTGSDHPVMSVLGSILRLGREARVHVVLASQQAAASWLQTSSRGQFAVRIALRNLSREDSQMVFGSPIATAGLENVPGRAWVSTGLGSVPEHAQIYWTPKIERGLNEADRAILRALGVALPDEDQPNDVDETAESEASLVDVQPDTPSPGTTDETDRAPHNPTPISAPAGTVDEQALAATSEEPAAALEDGMRILVDADGVSVPATVESVEPDDLDPDCLAVTYRLDDGELGVASLRDDETVPVLS
jgi:hypothetical protein